LLLKRADHLGVWADATTAADRADLALVGVRTLLTALHANADPEYRVPMLAPDCTLDQFIAANAATGPREMNSWVISKTGASLRLVTSVTEYQQSCARLVAAQQDRQRHVDADADEDQPRRRNRQWKPVPR
jgi:hypothetical protein